MRAFLSNICLRDSCYNCSFKKKYRNSDVTLADYWGVSRIHKNMNDDNGTSLVIVNSQKGKELFDLIKGNLTYISTDLDNAINYNTAMIKSVNYNSNRENFFKDMETVEFDSLINKYIPKTPLYKKVLRKVKRIMIKIIKK